MEKVLYIVRGIPGSGKSTFAKSLGGTHFEADMFFMKDGEYKFDMFKFELKSYYFDWTPIFLK